MDSVFNPSVYKERRQDLRKNMSEPERRMWRLLRNRQMGVKFRSQHGVGHYIADFYCPELNLVIEIDGNSHLSAEAQAYDRERDAFMQSLGIKTLRFTNEDVLHNIEGVHQTLCRHALAPSITP
jgi:very-short-patch-repair endonuclease